jgi:hypothetical protein
MICAIGRKGAQKNNFVHPEKRPVHHSQTLVHQKLIFCDGKVIDFFYICTEKKGI